MRSNDSSAFPSYNGPTFILKFLLIEKAEEQIKTINDDQAYLCGRINLFLYGPFHNMRYGAIKSYVPYEIEDSMKKNDSFMTKKFQEEDYKFALIEKDKSFNEFEEIDYKFYVAFLDSLKNLLIAGKNFDIEEFTHHEIFNEWFDNHANTYHRLIPDLKYRKKELLEDLKEKYNVSI